MQNEEEIVREFGNRMLDKIKIRHERYAPLGWKTLDTKRMVWLIEEELKELKLAAGMSREYGEGKAPLEGIRMIRDSKELIRDTAIDIANYALFLYEISK